MQPESALAGHHDLGLILVALVVCATGNWTLMALIGRARQATRQLRAVWIVAGAIVFGISVWAMHFVAMLAMSMAVPVFYDPSLSALSLAAAIGLSLPGIAVMARGKRPALAGLILAAAIAAMHYLGMAALSGPIHLAWTPSLVVLSLATGAVLAMAAMTANKKLRAPYGRVLATLFLSLAVGGLHYTGMAAVRLVPDSSAKAGAASVFPPSALAAMVIAAAMVIVFIGLASAYVDRFLEDRRNDESARLKTHIAALEGMHRELDKALEEAQTASQGKSAFLAAMSHELRTPLNAIIGFSELMVAEAFGPLGNPRYQSYAADIRKSGAHLLSLINDILDISRLEARKAELVERPVDLGQLLGDTRTMVENHAHEAGVQLAFLVAPDLPLLMGDERRIKQILLNLLSNAIKFTPAGGKVSLSAGLSGGAIVVRVEDTGIGISKEDLPKAFESFGQIDNRLSRRYEGSGLGLPLARHLAELHGGSLAIESEVDKGTCVTLRFPPERSMAAPERRNADLKSA